MDVGVDLSHFAVPSVTPAHDMIGDLLQRLDLHDLGAVGKNRHLAVARIPLTLQGLHRSGLELALDVSAVVK